MKITVIVSTLGTGILVANSLSGYFIETATKELIHVRKDQVLYKS